MKKKKEVLRACMGCGERKPKQKLIRIVQAILWHFGRTEEKPADFNA